MHFLCVCVSCFYSGVKENKSSLTPKVQMCDDNNQTSEISEFSEIIVCICCLVLRKIIQAVGVCLDSFRDTEVSFTYFNSYFQHFLCHIKSISNLLSL